MEGLATYAELDFEGDEDKDPIYSHLLKVVHYTAPAMNGLRSDREFRLVRYSRVVQDGLLARLMVNLVDHESHLTEHACLSGYLYVKALAQRLLSLCPRLAPPARMLPLLIRILYDHPALLDWNLSTLASEEILGIVHHSAHSLDAHVLRLIADWIETGDPADVVACFDSLDVTSSMQAGH